MKANQDMADGLQLSRAAEILRALVRCKSVTPSDDGALGALQGQLEALGFSAERISFNEPDTPDIDNLYARIGSGTPHLMFAGHTDVVPEGDVSKWRADPFAGDIFDGEMIGRGTVDMKGGIACFVAAVEKYLNSNPEFDGSISFLITGDEEGPAINGTDKLLKWASDKGESWDGAIVGEPSNPEAMGDAIKIGRRGSISGRVSVQGIQGHVAYPHLADNPVNGLLDMLDELLAVPFDGGSENFQASNLEVTGIDTGNDTTNVIPAQTSARFNIRFNDYWSCDSVKQEIVTRLERGANRSNLRQKGDEPLPFEVEWIGRANDVFLTRDDSLIETMSATIEAVAGKRPDLSTGGGTSDARFIKDYCPVIEFGLVGQTMHQIDERVALNDLDALSEIYANFLTRYFSA